MNPIIQLVEAGRVYRQGTIETCALRPTTLAISEGDFIALTGASGSGKSTLLNLVSGIDQPSSGNIRVAGTDLGRLTGSELARFRGHRIGIVFQFFELIATLTALENVALAMDLVGRVAPAERRRRARMLLEQVGLTCHENKKPAQMSGGEQQRVAIARALANDPPVLVADEPTGNLDSCNGDRVMDLFHTLAAAGRTVLIATHNRSHLHRFTRIITLADGAITAAEVMT
jgi:putative ABC transport system ATP-binding protein